MSGRSREAAAEGQGTERRGKAGHRVHFEALVAVGGLEGGAGFEAESVDVSAAGMRLRTAYLPTVGDKLVCRFDGLEGEVIVEGEVIWATEQQKGGEFGVRFVDLDDDTKEMLKQLCVLEDADEAAPDKEAESLAGTRVKLHIEGLGSPMKARVKSGNERELSVGSSLEFLKLGRTVELEDVDRQKRRDGFVDAVKVEIDPSTSIPQLVVSLRFDGVAPLAAKPAKADLEIPPKTKPGIGPEAEGAKNDGAKAEASKAEPVERSMDAKAKSANLDDAKDDGPAIEEAPGTVRAASIDPDAEIDEELDFGKSKLRVAGEKAKLMTTAAVGKIAPALSGLGVGAKGVWSKMGETLARRKEQRDADRKAKAPRRVTAPPPSGALKATGRKVVREEDAEGEPSSSDIPKQSRKKAMLGAGLGLALVVGVFGVVKATTGGAPDKKPVAAVEAASTSQSPSPALPPIPNAPATGEVPLFGATPLSTTEQIPAPPPVASGKAKADDGEGDGADAKEAAAPTQREWGTGDVSGAKTIKIKMDGPIAGITGEETEGGFTVKVPGRKSASSSTGLAHKDKRLAAFDVVNGDDGAEITVKFKGDVPGYLAKVKGDRLEIAIGGEAKKVASKSGKKKAGKKKPH